MSIVLDTSALLALLRGEAGAKKVANALVNSRMSVVNMAETASYYHRLGMSDDEINRMLRPLPVHLVAADADLAREVGRLRCHTAPVGLSLGDRFCLALAKRERLPAWTADRAWAEIADAAGVEVVTIR